MRSYQCHNPVQQTLKCDKIPRTQVICSRSSEMKYLRQISMIEMIYRQLLIYRKKSSAGTLLSENRPSAATLKRLKLKVTMRMIRGPWAKSAPLAKGIYKARTTYQSIKSLRRVSRKRRGISMVPESLNKMPLTLWITNRAIRQSLDRPKQSITYQLIPSIMHLVLLP